MRLLIVEPEAHYRVTCCCDRYRFVMGYDLKDSAKRMFGEKHKYHTLTEIKKVTEP